MSLNVKSVWNTLERYHVMSCVVSRISNSTQLIKSRLCKNSPGFLKQHHDLITQLLLENLQIWLIWQSNPYNLCCTAARRSKSSNCFKNIIEVGDHIFNLSFLPLIHNAFWSSIRKIVYFHKNLMSNILVYVKEESEVNIFWYNSSWAFSPQR